MVSFLLRALEIAGALMVSYLIVIFLWSLFFRPGKSGPSAPEKPSEPGGDPPCPTPPKPDPPNSSGDG